MKNWRGGQEAQAPRREIGLIYSVEATKLIELRCKYVRVTFCKNDTKSSNLIFDPLRFCSCLVKILVLARTWKISKLNSIGHVLLSYGLLNFTLKSAQNAKFAVDTLRWNNSNFITNWETMLTLNNYTGKMNSEVIKVSGVTPQLGHGWL